MKYLYMYSNIYFFPVLQQSLQKSSAGLWKVQSEGIYNRNVNHLLANEGWMHFLVNYINSLPNDKILDWSKSKDFAEDNLKFDENGGNLYKKDWNTVGEGEIARY